jgi:putative transposase
MSNYRRYLVLGGTYFFTLVTYQRRPLFADSPNVARLRDSIATIQRQMPFEFLAGVVLPDHLHFVWASPAGM